MSSSWLEESDRHWAYFLSLEEDLYQLSRFVDISQENFSTHSIECTRLLLASCSEAEIVLKLAAGLDKRNYLKDCLPLLGGDVDRLLNSEVTIRRSGLKVLPWHGWSANDSPVWWKAYNAVKHDRSQNYQEASLKNACYAVSGLFCSVLFYLRKKGIQAVFPAPRILKVSQGLGMHCMCPEGAFISLKDPG